MRWDQRAGPTAGSAETFSTWNIVASQALGRWFVTMVHTIRLARLCEQSILDGLDHGTTTCQVELSSGPFRAALTCIETNRATNTAK